MSDFKSDIPQPSTRAVALGFMAGLIVGAVATAGAFAWITQRQSQSSRTEARSTNAIASSSETSISDSHTPTLEEVRDFLDGKSFPLSDDPMGQSIAINKSSISELKWHSASNSGGDQFPWSHNYSFLYEDAGKHYIIDAWVEVRKVGSKLAFVKYSTQKVTPTDQIRGEKAAKR